MKMYHFQYEVHEIGTSRVDQEVLSVSGVSEERAREFAEHRLEEVYPGENYQLLSLECIAVEEE